MVQETCQALGGSLQRRIGAAATCLAGAQANDTSEGPIRGYYYTRDYSDLLGKGSHTSLIPRFPFQSGNESTLILHTTSHTLVQVLLEQKVSKSLGAKTGQENHNYTSKEVNLEKTVRNKGLHDHGWY